jgi:hypothetical protein
MSRFQDWEMRNLVKFAQDATVRLAELEADLKTAIQAYRYFMKPSHAPKLRELLRETPKGLSLRSLSNTTGVRSDTLRNTLKAMPDVYIRDWAGPFNGQWSAVYCLHSPPPDCPKPTDA